MDEFQFYENCTFCRSKIGSKHCLLPYQFLKQYVPPSDPVQRIIDITEIHTTYGLHVLEANYLLMEWVQSRPTSTASSSTSSIVYDPIASRLEKLKKENDSAHRPSGDQSSDQSQINTTSQEDKITQDQADPSKDEGVSVDLSTLTTNDPVQMMTKAFTPLCLEVQSSEIATPSSAKSSDKASLAGSSSAKMSEEHDARDLKNHLVQDLLMMAKTAFNLHAKKLGWIDANELKESILFESNTRNQRGRRYVPSFKTQLDGTIALSREIIARHDNDDLQLWESEKPTSYGNHCFLNEHPFTLPISRDDNAKLEEHLVRCFSQLLRRHSTKNGSRITLTDSVAYELVNSDNPSVFTWIKNHSQILESSPTPKPSTRGVAPKPSKDKKKTSEPYPNVDPRLGEFINTHLQMIVLKLIEENKSDLPTMRDETKVSTFLFKLASEFLLRNKGWHNENSFTNPQHLERLEESTGLKSRPSESILTFEMLKQILNEFRIRFKKRYPKQIPLVKKSE